LIQARLIIDGKDYGAHGFIVPIRSLKDHRPFPGVKVGDIGPKSYGGFSKIDNGCEFFYSFFSLVAFVSLHFQQQTNSKVFFPNKR
jgi:acyl-CoA oxidase